jgi:anti-sigma regulatory factor (Ser/Thr protein kinase)
MEPLTVQGNLNSIDKLVNYVATAASQAGLNHRATYCLRLAVDEIATNIVTHGYQAAGLDGEVTITAVFYPHQLVIELKDSGRPFDPRQVPPPANLKQPLQKRIAGNLGIFLATWGLDGFHYEHESGYNRNIFIMRHAEQEAQS